MNLHESTPRLQSKRGKKIKYAYLRDLSTVLENILFASGTRDLMSSCSVLLLKEMIMIVVFTSRSLLVGHILLNSLCQRYVNYL